MECEVKLLCAFIAGDKLVVCDFPKFDYQRILARNRMDLLTAALLHKSYQPQITLTILRIPISMACVPTYRCRSIMGCSLWSLRIVQQKTNDLIRFRLGFCGASPHLHSMCVCVCVCVFG